MSADFWASYASGALGICIGNRLDIIKTELQAGNRIFTTPLDPSQTTPLLTAHSHPQPQPQPTLSRVTSLFRGAAAPILGYGALNSILFVTYNRTLLAFDPSIPDSTKLAGASLGHIWTSGAIAGLACWVVSAPSELIKCRTQLQVDSGSSYATTVSVLRARGVRGLYLGGSITSLRDSIGYAWYFWSYELSKRLLLSRYADPFTEAGAADVLVAGGVAGVVTWASVFPLDVVKTRLQTQSLDEARSSMQIARDIMRTEGVRGFYRGLGVCSLRAFIVNAAQWYVYELLMKMLTNAPVP